MNSHRLALGFIWVVALALIGGCATAEGECPAGTALNSEGVCAPSRGDRGDRGGRGDRQPDLPDTRSSEATRSTMDASTDGDSSTTSGPETCDPGARVCMNPISMATCSASGEAYEDIEECPTGRRCQLLPDGPNCIIGAAERCEPGELVGCAGTTAELRCGPSGFNEQAVEEACSGAGESCRPGLGCSDAVCTPGATTCEGNQVARCRDDGSGTEVLRSCPSGCEAGTCVDPCTDDDKGGYVGCDFYAVFLDNFPPECSGGCPSGTTCSGDVCNYTGVSTTRFGLTASNVTEVAVSVRVFDGNDTEVASADIAPGGLAYLPIPIAPGWASGGRIDSNAYRVEATGAVTVHQFNPAENIGAFSNDASLLLPTNALGEDYLVLNWPTSTAPGTGSFLPSYVSIVAASEGTTNVTVRGPVAMDGGATLGTIPANTERTISLENGQVLTLYAPRQNNADLTGTSITSDNPIAVFSGSQCSNVPTGLARCDHMEQQLYPTSAWGDSFVGAKFRPRGSESDVYRVIALNDGTQIRTTPAITNVDGQILNRGEVRQFSESRHFEIEGVASGSGEPAPIQLGQFMVGAFDSGVPRTCPVGCGGFFQPTCTHGIGDPTYVLNVPSRQFLSEYVFFVPNDYRENAITVVAPVDAQVILDGAPIGSPPQPISGTSWVVYHRDVSEGAHTLSSDRAVGLYVYGYDCNVSYGYPGGLNLTD